LKWDSGSGTYFGVDPKLDMIYLMMQQTEIQRGRITRAFKELVYNALAADQSGPAGQELGGCGQNAGNGTGDFRPSNFDN
jgi:hypothetical protein